MHTGDQVPEIQIVFKYETKSLLIWSFLQEREDQQSDYSRYRQKHFFLGGEGGANIYLIVHIIFPS